VSSAYTCRNRPEKPKAYIAGNGYSPIRFLNWLNVTREQEWIMVEHAMSTDCKYTVGQPHDPRCAGCRWKTVDKPQENP
jgi:hypothetical protein